MTPVPACTLVAALMVAQNLPPELRTKKARGVDPTLPAVLVKATAAASKAEVDPKRGVGNALQILKAERRNYESDEAVLLALNIRIAATVLRSRFSHNEKVSESERMQQALSTYSKLDFAEPGLDIWLDKAIKASPKARELLAKNKTLRVAIMRRGYGLKKRSITTKLSAFFKRLDMKVVTVPAKQADFLVKVAAEEIRDENDKPFVRCTVTIEHREDNQVKWTRTLFRTSTSKRVEAAIDANLDWLLNVGGRDMFFFWLTEHGLPAAMMSPPKRNGMTQGHAH